MQKVSTSRQLDVVDRDDKMVMSLGLLEHALDSLSIHLGKVESLQATKSGARRATDHPRWFVLNNVLECHFAITRSRKVPGLSIRARCPEVESIESFDIQIAKDMVGGLNYAPAPIDFNKRWAEWLRRCFRHPSVESIRLFRLDTQCL